MIRRFQIPTIICALAASAPLASAALPAFADAWKKSSISPAAESFEIRGTTGRNNPIRRRLVAPFHGDEIFVRFNLRYDAKSIDTPANGNGEFFIMWLDEEEGTDTDTHNGGIPNWGVHVSNQRNSFMVRYASQAESHANIPLEGDRDYTLIARLWKTKPGKESPFNNLALWIDPLPGDEYKPHASRTSGKSISSVQWLGFGTGGKTERSDRIFVSDIRVDHNWRAILGLPPKARTPEPAYESESVPVVKKTVDFARHVAPILKAHCFECHSGDKPKGKFRLDVMDEAMNRVKPFDAGASRLIQLVSALDSKERMPPAKKAPALNKQQIATLKAWINEGFEWDAQLFPTPIPTSDHWAFQPIKRPSVPKVENTAWVSTPVDAFIARRHETLGLTPSPPADADALQRRMSLDLTGLPPESPADGKASRTFSDTWIDELLYSKHYGERWARHWLDLARWAESNGHQHNRDRPHAWRYRDYVIRAFNDDKPYDQFLREQMAGDELPYSAENYEALGFLAAARYSGNELDKAIQRNDILIDIVNTTSRTFLGLTVECAQCHTHKSDPISIRDYYRLQAFFATGQPGNIVLQKEDDRARSLIEERWRIFDGARARLTESRRKKGYPEPVLVIPKSVPGGMTASERKLYNSLEAEIAKLPQTWSYYSPTNTAEKRVVAPHEMRWPLSRNLDRLAERKTRIRVRGDVYSLGPEVTPGWPAVFGSTPELGTRPRTELAKWLTSPTNPLTARVWVNRIWQWHFGRGLVETSGDFGVHGASPSHPELLDWLASELISSDWSARHIHRLILDSSVYRQSSAFSQANHDIDPDNNSLWRRQPRRLEAEAIRDSVLIVAGILDKTAGGPSVPRAKADQSNRRSVYLQQKRDNLPHQQMLFDSANALTSCSRRRVSTVALQPLYLLNSDFMQRTSKAFADRVAQQAEEPDEQARIALELALHRPVSKEESKRAATLIEAQGLESFCLSVFNLNEFLYTP